MRRALCLFLILVSLPILALSEERQPQKKLTIMIYMCGSNLESSYGSASQDMEEIINACDKNSSVSVLLMIGGSKNWITNYDPDYFHIIEIGSTGKRERVSFPTSSMGQFEALREFLWRGMELCPADHYALILWDHGAGPMEGICFDEKYGMDSLSLIELEKALKGSPFSSKNPLLWIGFDACLMSTLETARMCAPYAEYMLASQETEPASGWNYYFLRDISGNDTAESIGQKIIDYYTDDKKQTDMLTMSMIQLNQVNHLEKTVDEFFLELSELLSRDTFSAISNSRLNTKAFGRASTASDYDLADLFHFSQMLAVLIPDKAQKIQSALANTVVYMAGNQEESHGLSLYSPYYNRERFLHGWEAFYHQMEILPAYSRFLSQYRSYWTAGSMADWKGLIGKAEPLEEDNTQTVVLSLDESQAMNFANASCLILEDNGSDFDYHNTYVIENLEMNHNILTAKYNFEALFAVDDDGVIETEPIPFIIRDGYYLIRAVLERKSRLEPMEAEEKLPVELQCIKNSETNELEIVNIYEVSDDDDISELNFGRQTVNPDPEKWHYILFSTSPRKITLDQKDNPLAYFQWEKSSDAVMNTEVIDNRGNILSYLEWMKHAAANSYNSAEYHHCMEADNQRNWRLRFIPRMSRGKELKAQFIIRDTQGNLWGSSLVPLNNPDLLDYREINVEPINPPLYKSITVQPYQIKVIKNNTFIGLCIRIRVKNNSEDEPVLFLVRTPVINKTPITDVFSTDRLIAPKEECIVGMLLNISSLPNFRKLIIRNISFVPYLINPELNLQLDDILDSVQIGRLSNKIDSGLLQDRSSRIEVNMELDISRILQKQKKMTIMTGY